MPNCMSSMARATPSRGEIEPSFCQTLLDKLGAGSTVLARTKGTEKVPPREIGLESARAATKEGSDARGHR